MVIDSKTEINNEDNIYNISTSSFNKQKKSFTYSQKNLKAMLGIGMAMGWRGHYKTRIAIEKPIPYPLPAQVFYHFFPAIPS